MANDRQDGEPMDTQDSNYDEVLSEGAFLRRTRLHRLSSWLELLYVSAR